ncbi:MAG: hypothetical protein VKQ33_16595 [Candidatus Sericytochromatia bacterium]|nr:hypothetical protein [Candidatus Sericytochromatia bacterium]
MQLQDTTLERNAELEATAYYVYRLESPARRWGIAVEHLIADQFNVSVTYCEAGWDVHGVVRYWSFDSRDLAEARYLELQRLLGEADEASDMQAMLALLPPPERGQEA